MNTQMFEENLGQSTKRQNQLALVCGESARNTNLEKVILSGVKRLPID